MLEQLNISSSEKNAMRRGIFLCVVFLISCAHAAENPSFSHDESFIGFDDIHKWMRKNIRYMPDEGDHWKTPEETYRDTTGDCEDISLLFMYFLWEQGEDSRLVLAWGENGYHALFLYENTLYEGYGYVAEEEEYTINKVLSFEEALRRTS